MFVESIYPYLDDLFDELEVEEELHICKLKAPFSNEKLKVNKSACNLLKTCTTIKSFRLQPLQSTKNVKKYTIEHDELISHIPELPPALICNLDKWVDTEPLDTPDLPITALPQITKLTKETIRLDSVCQKYLLLCIHCNDPVQLAFIDQPPKYFVQDILKPIFQKHDTQLEELIDIVQDNIDDSIDIGSYFDDSLVSNSPLETTGKISTNLQLVKPPSIFNGDMLVLSPLQQDKLGCGFENVLEHNVTTDFSNLPSDTMKNLKATKKRKKNPVPDELLGFHERKHSHVGQINNSPGNSNKLDLISEEAGMNCEFSKAAKTNIQIQVPIQNFILANSALYDSKHCLLQQINGMRLFSIDLSKGEKDVDFVINVKSAIIVKTCESISQSNSKSVILNLLKLKTDYIKLYTLLEVNEDFLREEANLKELLKFQLQCMVLGINTILCTSDSTSTWIERLSREEGHNISEVDLTNKSEDEIFLNECGLNPFQYKEILSKSSLPNFITMSIEQKKEVFHEIINLKTLVRIILQYLLNSILTG